MSNNFTPTERMESIKAGVITGASALVLFTIYRSLDFWVLPEQFTLNYGELLVSGLSAIISSFLFGATYRYVIRNDHNVHLKSGAVLAFVIVRFLAEIERYFGEVSHVLQLQNLPLLSLAKLGIENVLLFAIGALCLDFCFRKKWVKPFSN